MLGHDDGVSKSDIAPIGWGSVRAEKQVAHVANAFYRGRNDLVLLNIEETKLEPKLKWEPPAGPPAPGISEFDSFPHIFGPINLTAVASVLDFGPDPATGTFIFPQA